MIGKKFPLKTGYILSEMLAIIQHKYQMLTRMNWFPNHVHMEFLHCAVSSLTFPML